MKIRSPIVTLIIGVLVAVVTIVLSVRAHEAANRPAPAPYGAAMLVDGASR